MDNITKTVAALTAVLMILLTFQFSQKESEDELNSTYSTETLADTTRNVSTSNGNILRDFNNAIVNVVERANPAVVTITTTQTVRQRQRSPFGFFFNDPRFDQEREFQRSGLGSGVVVDAENGYIITNNHVIENADEIVIRLYNGDEYSVEVVGTDPGSDIAVLKVDAEDITSIQLGNSDEVRVGEMVFAIGSPLNERFAHTVSMGIVSASGRSLLGLNEFENYIQTDAAINPGNSGGALINVDGELVGINTAIASRSGGNQGLGFAIPVNMVRMVMESLIEDGKVTRGYLGLNMGGEVDRTMARALGMSSPRGFVVGDIVDGGPADRAGIASGDVIVRLNGEEVRNYYDFRIAISNTLPGTVVNLGIYRDGEMKTIEVELGERDADDIVSLDEEDRSHLIENLGFEVDELTDNLRQRLQLQPSVNGVVVANISQASRAYRQGLREYDVIIQVGNESIENSDQFYSSMNAYLQAEQDVILMRINRQGRNMFVAFEL